MLDHAEHADWDALRAQLLAHSEKVRRDESLLQALGLKLEQRNIVEFGPAALSRLEAARERETTARQEIEQIARANFAAQAQTHAMAVDLLEARNNSDLAARVHDAALTRFGVAAGALSVEGPGPVPAGWQALSPGLVDTILGGYAWRMGPAPALSQFFGEDKAAGLKSAALIRLHLWPTGRLGVLAFGSPEEDGFTPDMGAELVAFLAKVVERTADRWPPLA
jgi:uncharacterized protein YigA (DUF484 family)